MAQRSPSSRSVPQAGQAAPLHTRRGVVLGAAFLAMVSAAALVWVALGSMQSLARTLPVERVVFASAGRERLTEVNDDALQRIAEAVRTRRSNMIDIDLPGLRAAVKATAWVRDAEVRRQFPGTIEVAIEEHRPAARWNSGAGTDAEVLSDGRTRLVNTYGELFTAVISDERKADLPRLAGPDDASVDVLTRFVALKPALAAVERSPVGLSLSARRAWQLTLDNGSTLSLGRGDQDSDMRVQRFVATYREVPALQAAHALVDLRYPSGFTIQRSVETTSPKPAKANPAVNSRKKTT